MQRLLILLSLPLFSLIVSGLMLSGLTTTGANASAGEIPAPRRVDEQRAALAGVRKIVGQHLRLYTDLPASDAVDSLPVVFDAAVPLWAEYFRIDISELRNWRVQGYLIQDRKKFAALGLLPKDRPDFTNGYSQGYEFWWEEQSSDYFRRHLMLHEGTHAFMHTLLGDVGPGWYAEGMAELFGTHRWKDGQLELRVLPASRRDVPMWGRIKLIRETEKPLDLRAIMAFDKRRSFDTEEYSWCWAMCQFLDSHPRLQKEFRQFPGYVKKTNFNRRFHNVFRSEWADLHAEWTEFAKTLDYGYDVRRMTIEHRPSTLVTEKQEATILADRGWQATGWLVAAEQKYQVTASGRYKIAESEQMSPSGKIAEEKRPWPSEPGGITLEYHAGRPLGILLGCWREQGSRRFSEPFVIGLAATLQPSQDAELYLRVNDSPARLAENQGKLSVSILQTTD